VGSGANASVIIDLIGEENARWQEELELQKSSEAAQKSAVGH